MARNINTITAASLKAKEVATEDYVDTAVSNATISDATWQTKVQEAVNNDSTTINGSHIITGSIATDRIVANSINANILSADAINGKTTKGSINNVQFLSTHSSKYIDSSTFSIQSINGQ